MKNIFTIISILLFFSLLLMNATAVSFTSTSDPTEMNAGQSNQLVNFSIQNTGSVNITQLNITLPPGFTFTGTSGTTTSSSYTASSSIPSWTNSSSIGVVGNGATEYFWIYVNTPSSTGSYSFNITTLDANNAFSSNNVTFILFDTLAPTYSSNTTSPSTNSTYSANQSYWFNVTWTDNMDISKVLIEHNITGSSTPHNETMSNSSSIYYFNVTDLSAGIYVWKVYANDTNSTFNSTNQFTYVIRQATNELKVYLNGTLNSNITSIKDTAVNITVNASCTQPDCTITIARDGTGIVSGGSIPYSKSDDIITSIGLHNYSVSTAGNRNYTSNSSTYFVATVPSYSISSNIPLTYSNTTVGLINITFDSNPNLANLFIQQDWSSTAVNYTMSNSSVTSYYYNTTFPAGTYTWTLYGIYSNHTFNLTTNSFSINKAAPVLSLSITPQWVLDSPVETNVSCTVSISGLTANLYKNGTLVTNPDVQTFTAGSIYEYFCNNTVNQNYTTDTRKNTLIIRSEPTATLAFIDTPTLIEVTQNTTTSIGIKIKNTGVGVSQNVTFDVLDIDKNWYSITPITTNIIAGLTGQFTVVFNVGNAEIKEYTGKFNASSINSTVSQSFTVKVLPSNETKLKINDTITLFKLDLSKLETEINESKSKGLNISLAEEKLSELKSKIDQTENYVSTNDYFSAYQNFDPIRSLITETENLLKTATASEESGFKLRINKTWVYIGVGVTAAVFVATLIYLFWPTKKGFKPESGEYVWTGEERKTIPAKRFIEKIKSLFSKLRFKKRVVEKELPES